MLKQLTLEEDLTPRIIKYKGDILTSPKDIAKKYGEFLNDKVEEIRRNMKCTNFKAIQIFKMIVPKFDDEIVFKSVGVGEIKKIINGMKNSKTRGDSELTNRVVKALKEYLSLAITHLTSQIYRTGTYPSFLKTSRILPLQKRGKEDDTFNCFRPINNLNPIDKIIEEAIRSRIDTHLVEKGIIPNNSHGCRGGHSMVTAIQQIEKTIKINKSKGRYSAIHTTDLTSAFNLVDHSIMLEKMEHVGIRGKPYAVIESYLSNRRTYCEVQGFTSNTKDSKPYSVIQGGKLSGQFFGVFTLEMTQIAQTLRNPEVFKFITGKKLSNNCTSKVSSCGYVNNINHITSNDNKDKLERITQDAHILTVNIYKENRLLVNDNITRTLQVEKNTCEAFAHDRHMIEITYSHGKTVKAKII